MKYRIANLTIITGMMLASSTAIAHESGSHVFVHAAQHSQWAAALGFVVVAGVLVWRVSSRQRVR